MAITYGLLREARAVRIASGRSEVVADLVGEGPIFVFVVENAGRSPATDITIDVAPERRSQRGNAITSLFRRIAGLAAGRSRRYVVTVGHQYMAEERPATYEVRVAWTDGVAGPLKREYMIDAESHRMAHAASTFGQRVADDLEHVAKAFEELVRRPIPFQSPHKPHGTLARRRE